MFIRTLLKVKELRLAIIKKIFGPQLVLSPSIVELMISVGLISFGILLFTNLAKKILVQKSSQEDQFSKEEGRIYSLVENG
jgi:Ni/Fe-hydrogenase subunit HybB-like protein